MSDLLLPTYEEITEARDVLSRIIEGIEEGIFTVGDVQRAEIMYLKPVDDGD